MEEAIAAHKAVFDEAAKVALVRSLALDRLKDFLKLAERKALFVAYEPYRQTDHCAREDRRRKA